MSQFSNKEKQILLDIVDKTICHGLETRQLLEINLADFPENLCAPGASFVTLEINHMLRGCIGSLLAYQPLIVDVCHNTFAAAFQDPRFSPLTKDEYPVLTKHISVLSKPEPIYFTSEEDLLSQIRPGVDGLILSDLGARGTFLPTVWESIPDPKLFLAHLKQKAGLPMDYWSDSIQVERYITEVIE
ncbi:MAG: AmmeMemoRadiSam system protein A [Gammaproteobacteria bacterium]|nr:AmmeMemoRadiSam system protein A [Gammaproteobacteria bacterium]